MQRNPLQESANKINSIANTALTNSTMKYLRQRKTLGSGNKFFQPILNSKQHLLIRYSVSALINFSISLVLYVFLGLFLSSTLAYATAYILTIFSGSVIHLKNTFIVNISRKNFLIQAGILGVTGIAATSIVSTLSPAIGFTKSGIAGIIFSAAMNLLLSYLFIQRKN